MVAWRFGVRSVFVGLLQGLPGLPVCFFFGLFKGQLLPFLSSFLMLFLCPPLERLNQNPFNHCGGVGEVSCLGYGSDRVRLF